MKFSLCLAAAALLVVGCSAIDENQIFQNYEQGWTKFTHRFLLSRLSWTWDRLDQVAERLCPASTLFELQMKNVLNARNVGNHHTSLELINENKATTYNRDSVPRTMETTEFRANVDVSVLKKTSNAVAFKNQIGAVAGNDIESEPQFRIQAGRSARQNELLTEEINNEKKLITSESERVTLGPNSKVDISNQLYKYYTIKDYLLDIELDREQSLVHWTNCRGFRVVHDWRHLFSDEPSNFNDRKITNHVEQVTSHQSDFDQYDGRIEYHNGKMIAKNVPVQIVYTVYKVLAAVGEPEPINE